MSVSPVGADGRDGDPMQVIPTARNAHAKRVDNTNHFVFAPHLGTDQVFQFLFDEKSGRLTTNTPQVLQRVAPGQVRGALDNRERMHRGAYRVWFAASLVTSREGVSR